MITIKITNTDKLKITWVQHDKIVSFLRKSQLGKYWSRYGYERYYFDVEKVIAFMNSQNILFNINDILTYELKYNPIYYDCLCKTFSTKSIKANILCKVLENVILKEIDGLNDKSKYENGILKELIDDGKIKTSMVPCKWFGDRITEATRRFFQNEK